MADIRIACPNCDWEPDGRAHWVCDACFTVWDTFDTTGICPGCRKQFTHTDCVPTAGGCPTNSPHLDWYHGLDEWVAEQLELVAEVVEIGPA